MIIPEELITQLLGANLREVDWITSLPYVVLEAEDDPAPSEHIVHCLYIIDGDRVGYLLQSKVVNDVDVIGWADAVLG